LASLFNIQYFSVNLITLADFLLAAFLAYQIYKIIKGSPVVDILLGFIFLYIIYLVVDALGMKILTTILGQFVDTGVIIMAILFQQEIRKILFLVGERTSLNKIEVLNYLPWKKTKSKNLDIDLTPILEASKSLAQSNTGALIVISRNDDLGFYEQSGDRIDAVISKRLLVSIFNKQSPMHDGAVLIYRNRIKAARCILPITEKQNLPPHFGLRHRAAIGMSEATSVLVVVISEETGQISIVQRGNVLVNLSPSEIRNEINKYFES
jgi:diadenylate cyclase